MSVYVIADVKVNDGSWIPEYAQKVHHLVHKHGGKYLSRSANIKTLEGEPLDKALAGEAYLLCRQALEEQRIIFAEDYVVAYCSGKNFNGSLLYLTGVPGKLTKANIRLLNMFAKNVQLAFDNVLLSQQFESTRDEIKLLRQAENNDKN